MLLKNITTQNPRRNFQAAQRSWLKEIQQMQIMFLKVKEKEDFQVWKQINIKVSDIVIETIQLVMIEKFDNFQTKLVSFSICHQRKMIDSLIFLRLSLSLF